MDSSAWLPPDICRWAETPTTSVPPLDCGISAVTPPELMDELCENSLPQLETSTATRITRMSIKTLEIRSTTRIRVFWSSATGIPSAPGSYTLLSLDGRGAPPTAVAVLVVAADSTQRELLLSWGLVGGASYPLSDGVSTTRFVTPEPRPAIAAGLTGNSFDREFFKVDLFFDGTDFVEQIDGDLAEVAGGPNGRAAFHRG